MRIRRTALIALLALASPATIAHAATPHPYRLVDPGTFGGPQSGINLPGVPLGPHGALLGTADTTLPDPSYPNDNPFVSGANPYLTHAFAWDQHGLHDLGALPGANSSAVFQFNSRGVGAGMSTTGTSDPFTGYPEEHAVVFRDGKVIDIGTLPGGRESQAIAINDRAMVAGFSNNGVPDPASIFPWGTQTRGFVWEHGVMHDLGTLGGPDADMAVLNAHGQIAGDAYTDATPNDATGVPTTHPYLWTAGHMRDLGTLGGTWSVTNWLNDRGEVVGQSNLSGDQATHPFLWDGRRLLDLGTLGGTSGNANWIDQRGDVAGTADLPDGTHHGVLWRDARTQDLVPVDGAPCSNANGVNAYGDAVGNATDCHGHSLGAVLWRHGHGVDLNTLIAPSPMRLLVAEYIDDHGEIVGTGALPGGAQRIFLLIPAYH